MTEARTASATIRVQLNGESRNVPVGSVAGMLAFLEIDPRTVVVELNREIVRRNLLETTPVHDGDAIELVHFVGGG